MSFKQNSRTAHVTARLMITSRKRHVLEQYRTRFTFYLSPTSLQRQLLYCIAEGLTDAVLLTCVRTPIPKTKENDRKQAKLKAFFFGSIAFFDMRYAQTNNQNKNQHNNNTPQVQFQLATSRQHSHLHTCLHINKPLSFHS